MNDEIFGYKVRKLTNEEHKQRVLDILIDVAEFCDRHNLRYFLAYGTLIGAIRHGGFIPWDDDIDIQMPRPDYEKFAELYNLEKHQKNYRAIMPNDERSHHSYMKVCDLDTLKIENAVIYDKNLLLGIDIDIFPLDGLHLDKKKYSKNYRLKMKLLKRLNDCNIGLYTEDLSYNLIGILKRIKRISRFMYVNFMKFFPSWKKINIVNQLHDLETELQYDDAELVGSVAYYGSNKIQSKSNYDESILVDFEGYKFKAPKGYDSVLKTVFGDYMKLPPVDQQVSHHANEVYEIINEERS